MAYPLLVAYVIHVGNALLVRLVPLASRFTRFFIQPFVAFTIRYPLLVVYVVPLSKALLVQLIPLAAQLYSSYHSLHPTLLVDVFLSSAHNLAASDLFHSPLLLLFEYALLRSTLFSLVILYAFPLLAHRHYRRTMSHCPVKCVHNFFYIPSQHYVPF